MGNKSRGNMKEAMKNQKRSLLRCAMPCYVAFHIDRFSIFRRQLEGVNGYAVFWGQWFKKINPQTLIIYLDLLGVTIILQE